MTRYRAIYDREGLKAEFDDGVCTYYRGDPGDVPDPTIQVIRDIDPYQSMIDGSMITSRREHREHLARHGCFEVGNEKFESTPRASQPDTRREMLARRLGDMSDRQANQILKQLRS